MTDETYNSDSFQIGGKLAFLLGFIFSTSYTIARIVTIDISNLIAEITIMDVLNVIVVLSSIVIGIPYAYYKLKNEHHDFVLRKERRKQTGEKPIKFRWKFWKSWGNRKKK